MCTGQNLSERPLDPSHRIFNDLDIVGGIASVLDALQGVPHVMIHQSDGFESLLQMTVSATLIDKKQYRYGTAAEKIVSSALPASGSKSDLPETKAER